MAELDWGAFLPSPLPTIRELTLTPTKIGLEYNQNFYEGGQRSWMGWGNREKDLKWGDGGLGSLRNLSKSISK